MAIIHNVIQCNSPPLCVSNPASDYHVKERLVEDEQQTAISSGSSNPLLYIHYEG